MGDREFVGVVGVATVVFVALLEIGARSQLVEFAERVGLYLNR